MSFPLTPIDLGTAITFGAMATTAVTNVGTTTINGDLGIYPGTSVTGNPTVIGSTHIADSTVQNALADASAAYNQALTLPISSTLAFLDGKTLI